MSPPLAVFLTGPTASGKTGVAVELVQRLPVDIISVDSALVYRGMDIGTAKPDAQTLALAPHRLIDIRDPLHAYSAAEFRDDALREMQDIVEHGRIPLLVGGTMLYFRALENGLSDLPGADPQVRARLEAEAEEHGWSAMHARLHKVDPEAAARIHPNDPQRIQRALEVYELSGLPLTELHRRPERKPAPYRFLKIMLAPGERALLHERIAQRFQSMLQAGFLDEVRRLRQRPELHPDLPSMRAVGYRQAWAHLDGSMDETEWVERAIAATRQYAKRQSTWFRGEPDLHRIDSLSADAAAVVENLAFKAGATVY